VRRGSISPAQINELKARISLRSLIGSSLALQRDGQSEFIALCPFHSENTPSFRIYPDDHFYCFGCGAHGDQIDWLRLQENASFTEALRRLREWSGTAEPSATRHAAAKKLPANYGWTPILPVPASAPPLITALRWTNRIYNPKRAGQPSEWATWRPSLVHPYRSASGELLGYVLRVDIPPAKKFTPTISWCRNAAGEQRWCLVSFPDPRPLYGLDRLAKSPSATVVLVEGEKTADAGQRLMPGYVVMTWAGGGKSYAHTNWMPLVNRKVLCIPDNDAPGRSAFDGRTGIDGTHVPGIAETLINVGASVWRVNPPTDLPDGWDLADAEADGWSADCVVAWIKTNVAGGAA
jgi:hypothetical protein